MYLPTSALSKVRYTTLTVIKNVKLSLLPAVSSLKPVLENAPLVSLVPFELAVPICPTDYAILSTSPRTVGCLSGVLGI